MVDVEGAVIAPAVREAYPNLPLVVGEGAGKNAANLFETLALRQRDQADGRSVAGWRPALDAEAFGVDVMLPDDGVADALKTLINGSRPEPAPARDRRCRSSSRRPRERAHPRQG